LFLDEPTNHLDIEGIVWLENFLKKLNTAYVVISHDRYFLETIGNKIFELNQCYPSGLFISNGGINEYYEQKELFLQGLEAQEQGLSSVVRRETEWLRRSPKARTTKSVSRINRAHQLMDDLSDVKKRRKSEKAKIEFSASDRQTRK